MWQTVLFIDALSYAILITLLLIYRAFNQHRHYEISYVPEINPLTKTISITNYYQSKYHNDQWPLN